MAELIQFEQRLREEFQNMPHTRTELLGNAACERKIRSVIIAHIIKGDLKGECIQSMKDLMIEEGVSKDSFKVEIDPYIDLYYKAKELIDNGYCEGLKEK